MCTDVPGASDPPTMTTVEFSALEYLTTQDFSRAHYRIVGDETDGFSVFRNDRLHLSLGPGYRLLRPTVCGICSTDLARHHLTFPLPQITGHEIVAIDGDGQRWVAEINASHQARGVESSCPYCKAGIANHCPDRLVLGIHDLPGGFGSWLLAPVNAVHPVPAQIPTMTAVIIEPFAAALHAVTTMNPAAGETVAVLGPRRLGLLVVAALAGHRRRSGIRYRIVAVSRHSSLLDVSRRLGADEAVLVDGNARQLQDGMFDRVVDTTGTPSGLELALRIARREVHLKSTHGQPSAGLGRLTELVVDELTLAPYVDDELTGPMRGAWLVEAPAPPRWMLPPPAAGLSGPAALLAALEAETGYAIPRVDRVVVGSATQADLAIRPSPDHERSLVMPRGEILVHPQATTTDCPLLAAIVERKIRVSSSRCGDFQRAFDLMVNDPELCKIGEELVTHQFSVVEIARAFEVARSPHCIKVVVQHAEQAAL
jgi:threonine dehydrogenase-like Zn-dependent dehydrogenase